MYRVSLKYIFPFMALFLFQIVATGQNKTMIWRLDQTGQIGGMTPVLIGDLRMERDNDVASLFFNGKNAGLIIPINPLEDKKEFTVEVLFNPSCGGNKEQRFVHFQDKQGNRGLIEIRILQKGKWCLDTYLHVGSTNEGLTLRDDTALHPCDEWYWAALRYDGKTMIHYVNGAEEISGEIDFGPMELGLISIGVRLNQIYWFEGKIREIRFHPKALQPNLLQLTGN